MDGLKYPLEQLMQIKNKRFEQALKILEEKTAILEKEKKILLEKEAARDSILTHKRAKLTQLRESLDKGEGTDKLQMMKTYLKVVDEKLFDKEIEVKKQKDQVVKAEKECEIARINLFNKKKDVEKLEIHKKIWQKEFQYWISQEEALEEDEIGSIKHAMKKKQP